MDPQSLIAFLSEAMAITALLLMGKWRIVDSNAITVIFGLIMGSRATARGMRTAMNGGNGNGSNGNYSYTTSRVVSVPPPPPPSSGTPVSIKEKTP